MKKRNNKNNKWNNLILPEHYTKAELDDMKYVIERLLEEGISREDIQIELNEANKGKHPYGLLFHHLAGLVTYNEIKLIMKKGYTEEEALNIWSKTDKNSSQ